jgi:class 3 adenylate cyclase
MSEAGDRAFFRSLETLCEHAIIDKLVGDQVMALDLGSAFVGNVGSGGVKDFTAIGDVVNTAARLQAAAASGEIVMSSRVHDRAGGQARGAETRTLALKGKSQPEVAMVSRFDS